MTPQDLEQKLKDLAAATAPSQSLVSRVMDRVNQARQPRRPSFLRFFPASPTWRAVAAILTIATVIAVIAIELHPRRNPTHPAPLVQAHLPSSDVLAVRVLDIRRIDFKSPDALDTLLRDSSSVPSPEPVIRVSDLSRPDLNLY